MKEQGKTEDKRDRLQEGHPENHHRKRPPTGEEVRGFPDILISEQQRPGETIFFLREPKFFSIPAGTMSTLWAGQDPAGQVGAS